MFSFGSRAQGTIEYLVVIAIVVVISLVVVGIVFTTNSSGDTAIKSAELRNSVGVIGFAEPVVDGGGDGLIGVSNNTGEAISISKISVAGVEKVFSESLPIGSNKLFYLTDLGSACNCSVVGANKICEVVVTYVSGYGLEKTETREVVFSCVGDAVAKSATVVGLTAVCGSSAQSYSWSATDFSGSFCSVGDVNVTPSFPVQGASVSWGCLGTDLNVTCSASRGSQAVVGLCGDANQTYAYDITSFGSDTFCTTGDENVTPSFPAQGASVSWKCVADTNAECAADRNSAPSTEPIASFAKGSSAGSSSGGANSVFVDSSGNIYVTGGFSSGGHVNFGNNISVSSGSQDLFDFFVVKYGSDGNALWAKSPLGQTTEVIASSEATHVSVDSSGNVYVTGNFDANSLGFGNDVNLTNQGGHDFFVVKYDSSGVAQWAKGPGVGATQADYGQSVSVDATGNVYLAGLFFSDELGFGNDVNLTNKSSATYYADFFVVKYNSGGVVQWAQGPADGAGAFTEQAASVFVDSGGNIYLAGDFYTTSSVGFGNGVSLPWRGSEDFFVVKYGSDGNALWAQGAATGSGNGAEYGYSAFVDVGGNVYLAGSFQSTTLGFGNDVNLDFKSSSSSDPNFFVVKYDSSGVAQWAQNAANGVVVSSDFGGLNIFVDSDNNVYLAGSFSSAISDFGNDVNLTKRGGAELFNNDFFVVNYNSSGVAQWAMNPVSGTGAERDGGYDVYGDSSGNIYVVGNFTSSTLGFGNNVNLSNGGGNSDFFLVKYGSS